MKLKQFLVFLILSACALNSEASKVIYARNTTAQAVRRVEAEKNAREREAQPDKSTIINIPGNCKAGFVFETTFHNRCRKVAR
jgi:hypothetical protein